jgi:thioesterase domain-containing protein
LPPFFAAAGMGGNPMNLRYIAKHLGPEQPFFGLQHRGTDGQQPPHTSVASMAQEYLEHIRRQQPHGPYYLGGFSAGGIAAFEVAKLLEQAGEPVALVVMFDAASPLAQAPDPDRKRAEHRRRLRERGPRYVADIAYGRLLHLSERLRIRGGAWLARVSPYRFRNEAVTAAWERALASYRPEPYGGNVVVLRARCRDDWTFDRTNGWAPLVSGTLEVIDVDGGHTSHVGAEHARGTAEALKTALVRARASSSR